jgi:hypothetical protein
MHPRLLILLCYCFILKVLFELWLTHTWCRFTLRFHKSFRFDWLRCLLYYILELHWFLYLLLLIINFNLKWESMAFRLQLSCLDLFSQRLCWLTLDVQVHFLKLLERLSLSLSIVSRDIFLVILQLRNGRDLSLRKWFLVLVSLYRWWRKLIGFLRVGVIHSLGFVGLSSALHAEFALLLKWVWVVAQVHLKIRIKFWIS